MVDGECHKANTQSYLTHRLRNGETRQGRKGADESYTETDGGEGAKFRSKDEAAFAWALENVQYAKSGENERAGTIYSQKSGTGGKTFSYNGAFEGSEVRSDFRENFRPKGSTLEAFIHTHPRGNDFSQHYPGDAYNANRRIDQEFMKDDNLYIDFYLVNPNKELIVSRRSERIRSSGDPSRNPSIILASGLNGVINLNKRNWQGADGKNLNLQQQTELHQKLKAQFKL